MCMMGVSRLHDSLATLMAPHAAARGIGQAGGMDFYVTCSQLGGTVTSARAVMAKPASTAACVPTALKLSYCVAHRHIDTPG
jgi:hypothetical protein